MSSDTPAGTTDSSSDNGAGFADLGLPEVLLRTLQELGYEAPTPIQAATIPALLSGRDLVGQAQTGTGKTAAFALPVLAGLKPDSPKPSALVLAPTRELAIQVAEAFHRYAQHLPGFHVLPVYGGQSYGPQLAGLRRGADIVVGTPGRVIDHLEKGTLDLARLETLVLDEADEMLRMGFIDDVEQVLEKMPAQARIALFSATMPDPIRRIAQRHLKNPVEVTIRSTTTTAATIRQRYWLVEGMHKLDALTRILEVESFEAMLVFARTRVATEELAHRLSARGFSASALNGDVPQQQREQLVERLKSGEIDILVATDVAARGLDVERITHVINYDIPYDTEAYVHRIGRTGRAGRSGQAILFVAPRERGMLRAIERATRQPIEAMGLPTVDDVNARRVGRFKAAVAHALENEDLAVYRQVAAACQEDTGAEMIDIAAALARLFRGGDDLLLTEPEPRPTARERKFRDRPERSGKTDRGPRPARAQRSESDDSDKRSYRIEVGNVHGVRTGNIVGAIANEANLDAAVIGRIRIQQNFSLVDLPANLSPELLDHLAKVRVAGQALRIRPDQGPGGGGPGGRDSRGDRQQRPRRGPPRQRDSRPGLVRETHRSSPRPGPKPSDDPNHKSKPRTSDGDKPPRKRPVQTRAARKAGHTAPRFKPKDEK